MSEQGNMTSLVCPPSPFGFTPVGHDRVHIQSEILKLEIAFGRLGQKAAAFVRSFERDRAVVHRPLLHRGLKDFGRARQPVIYFRCHHLLTGRYC